ncbi:MAG: acetyl-CoA carboxylase biotin carboxyl carrier protein [Verrucomicrobia bacterium]|nr:acetyl-CoA carboxylase biotin carboxyl carrier protein [Verrucomicrobiota bacterium]MBS0645813.1 acetyl-CoA carboxylase biotin carboxyl carrier protein [Verrucomicrobiota bacterium]
MDVENIEKLMAMMQTYQIHKLGIKNKDFELSLEKEGEVVVHHAAPLHSSVPMASQPITVATPAAAATSPDVAGLFVTSPIVGTFYASPSPQDAPFVKVGDRVTADSVVCIIEAMKVMNEVKAGVAGVVAEVFVKSGDPVEFGTKILRIT